MIYTSVAHLPRFPPLLLSGSFLSFGPSVFILLSLHSTPRRLSGRLVFVLQRNFSCFISNFYRVQTDPYHLTFCCPFALNSQIGVHEINSHFWCCSKNGPWAFQNVSLSLGFLGNSVSEPFCFLCCQKSITYCTSSPHSRQYNGCSQFGLSSSVLGFMEITCLVLL